jgi:hypothetical protein
MCGNWRKIHTSFVTDCYWMLNKSVEVPRNIHVCTVRFASHCARNVSGLYRRSWTSLPTPFISAQRLSERRSAQSFCEYNWTGSGPFRRSWTSRPTALISAQRLSERNVRFCLTAINWRTVMYVVLWYLAGDPWRSYRTNLKNMCMLTIPS